MFPAITCYSIAEFSIDIEREREMQSSTDLRICMSYYIIRLYFRRISVHRYTPISAEYPEDQLTQVAKCRFGPDRENSSQDLREKSRKMRWGESPPHEFGARAW